MSVRFAVCPEMLFPDLPFLTRVERVRAAGFDAIEIWGWKDKDLDGLARLTQQGGLKVVAMSGARQASLIQPPPAEGNRREVEETLAVAERLGCARLVLLSDALEPDGSVRSPYARLTLNEKTRHALVNLRDLAKLAEDRSVTLLLEPLNNRVDHPGIFLQSSTIAFTLVEQVGSPRLKVLFDCYHMQVMEGNLIATIRRHHDLIGHYHIADPPARTEPGTGELHIPNLLKAIAATGYDGWVGFECRARKDGAEALRAIRAACATA
ncbi:MAG: hydroxypyruvate isomerase family protein [Candidatus Methylomirabilales bacterium]